MAAVDPNTFLSPNGHLVYHGTVLALFLVLLALLVVQRTNDLLQVVIALACFALPLRAFSPVFGFGAAYPDMPGTLLYGCGLYALLLSRGNRLGWLVVFGCFVGLLGLARSVAVGYLAWLTLPIVAVYAVRNMREGRSILSGLVLPCLAVLVPIALIAGLYTWRMLTTILQFYWVAGYGLMTTSVEIIGAMRSFFTLFVGKFALWASLPVFLFTLWRGGFFQKPDWLVLLGALWIGSGHLILAAFILQTSDPLAIFFALPGLLVLLVAPVPWTDDRRGTMPKRRYSAAVSLAVAICGIVIVAFRGAPDERIYSDAKFNSLYLALTDETHRLAEDIAKTRTPTIETAFWEYGRFIVVGNMSRYHQNVAWRKHLEVHGAQWGLGFPGKSAEEIADQQYPKIKRDVDLFLVLEDPSSALARPVLYSDITVAIYESLNRRVKMEKDAWTLESRVPSQWGDILIYRNRSRG